MKCSICSFDCNDNKISLTNGEMVHHDCERELFSELNRLTESPMLPSEQEILLQNQIYELKSAIDGLSSQSFSSLISELFFGFTTSKERNRQSEKSNLEQLRNSKIQELNQLRSFKFERLDREINRLKSILDPIYDYWPTYPPDWNDRREKVEKIAEGICRKCGFKKYPKNRRRRENNRIFHIHHQNPLSKGGSHCANNLIFLCEKCHQKAHAHDFTVKHEKKDPSENRNSFIDKLNLINEAIEKKQVLQFRYKKRSGEVMIREIIPIKIGMDNIKQKVQVISGYCLLRKEARHFTIKRMSKICITGKVA